MKKVYFLAALLLCSLALFAQEYKVEGNEVVFTKVVENTGKTVAEAHDALEAFFALRYNDVNSTQKLNQPDHLIYKGLFAKTGVYSLGMWTIDVPHTIDVAIKDNRIRIKITITEGIYRSLGNSPNKTSYIIANAAPIGSGSGATVMKKDAIHTFEEVCERIDALMTDIEESLDKSTTEEDW